MFLVGDMIRKHIILPLLVLMLACSCSGTNAGNNSTRPTNDTDMTTQTTPPDTATAKVRFTTNLGSFTVLLYGDTPKHRDNFLRLAREHYYDGTLFHRVIKNFMVQAGDPDSRNAAPGAHLGAGGPDYKIDAEIVFPTHFHKRYALAAARQGDQVNPRRQSSGSQFYVVTGNRLSEPEIAQYEQHMRNSHMQKAFNQLALEQRDNIIAMQRAGDRQGLQALQDTLISRAQAIADEQPVQMSAEMREAYTTVGGAPHLDGDYTVFGEVIDGTDTIDRIEAVTTGAADRPREDVRIISTEVL